MLWPQSMLSSLLAFQKLSKTSSDVNARNYSLCGSWKCLFCKLPAIAFGSAAEHFAEIVLALCEEYICSLSEVTAVKIIILQEVRSNVFYLL